MTDTDKKDEPVVSGGQDCALEHAGYVTPKKDERAEAIPDGVIASFVGSFKVSPVIPRDSARFHEAVRVAMTEALKVWRALRPDPSAGEREEAAKFFDRMAAAHHGELHGRYRLAALALRQPAGVTEWTDEQVDAALIGFQSKPWFDLIVANKVIWGQQEIHRDRANELALYRKSMRAALNAALAVGR